MAKCTQYNLESIKQKAAEAIINRLPLYHDPLSIVGLASGIYDESFPQIDRGLRKAIIAQLHTRLSAIMDDEEAWKECSENKAVLKALHAYQCEMLDAALCYGILTPPATPTKR